MTIMNTKTVCKILLDVLMLVCLFLLMGYHFWGEIFHKILGMGTLFLFLLHQYLNLHWYKNLGKGKYSPFRILALLCIVFLVLVFAAQGCSGMRMAQDFFPALNGFGNMSTARRLHILGSHWGFLLISFHLGLQWNTIKNYAKKILPLHLPRAINLFGSFFCLLFSCYGIWAFITRNFADYLFLRTEFVMLDYEEAKFLFYIDFLAIMGLCILLARLCIKILQKIKGETL